jgi:hypothetical protein
MCIKRLALRKFEDFVLHCFDIKNTNEGLSLALLLGSKMILGTDVNKDILDNFNLLKTE